MSKANLATLVVTLGANSAQLVEQLKTTKNSAKEWAGSMKSIASKAGIAFFGAVAAAGAAGTGFIAIVEKQAAQLDALAKKADKLGLGVGALQKLEYQASLTGISQDTLGTALQRMTRRVAEAADGTGEARKAIAELGLDAEKLAGMSPDKQFYAIAEAMKGIPIQGDRIKLAMKIFDSEGVGLVNTFAANLDELGKRFDSLGVSFSSPALEAVQAYNDAKTDLDTIFTGLQQKVTVGVVPAMEVLVSKTVEFIQEMGGVENVAQRMTTGALTAIQKIVQGFETLINMINDVKLAFNTIVGTGQIMGSYISKGVAKAASVAKYTPNGAFLGADELERKALMMAEAFDSAADGTAAARVKMVQDAAEHSARMKELIGSVGKAKEKVIEGFNKQEGGGESEQVTQWRNEIAALQQQIMNSPGQNVAPVLAEINALKDKIVQANDPVVTSTDGNTSATEQNTLALNAAAAAMGAKQGSGNSAWDKIFGTPKDGKKQGDQVDRNFSRAAQEYQNAIANGATGSAEAAAKRMKEILESYQKNPYGHSAATADINGKWGFSTGRADEYDVGGMQAVMEKLLKGEAPNMGSITVNVKKEDGGEVSGTVTGEQAFLQQLANIMSNVSTAV
ncbi:hypothetical protein [Marinobacterium sp. BA1]|uniref:hypothetical protein n=1 Tax=Marinobacterium sp. BA1 TaxID=3138931 RepID=UPI0032E72FD4